MRHPGGPTFRLDPESTTWIPDLRCAASKRRTAGMTNIGAKMTSN